MASTTTTDTPPAVDFRRPPARARKEAAIRVALAGATVVGIVVLVLLMVRIAAAGAQYISVDFLTSFPSRRDPASSGISNGLTGTLSLMALVTVGSFPLGIGAALYLEEFAPQNRLTDLLESNISNLAGVPSVVYGLLGAGLFVGMMGSVTGGRSLISAAMTLILLILPVIIVTSREAIKAVPTTLREGGLGLGATRWQTTWKLVLPQALPGMITGAILGLSRAIGEAAPILVVGAASVRFQNSTPFELREQFSALPVQIFSYTFDPSQIVQDIAASAIIVLMVALLLMNGFAIYFRNRASRGRA